MSVPSPEREDQATAPAPDHRAPAAAPPTRRGSAGRAVRVPWWFVIPALAVYAAFVLYPSLSGGVVAFTDWDGLTQARNFVGFENFQDIFDDQRSATAVVNTFVLAAVVTVATNLLGLVFALLLNSTKVWGRTASRTVLFVPVMMVSIVVAYLWQYLLSPRGPVSLSLLWAGLDRFHVSFLGDPSVALWSIAMVVVWQFTGLTMVIYLAGLQAVPKDLYESAAVEGAGTWQQFWYVTRPMIAPATTIATVLMLIYTLKLFDQVFVLTGGGPGGATETLSTALYREAFSLANYGYGAAIAVLLTIGVVAAAFLQYFALRRMEVEG